MEIELYSKLQNPIDAIAQLGKMFAKSGMFGCDREEQGQVLAMICLAERKSPVAITTNYDIVEGKLRKKALAALADFRSAGGKHKWLSSGDIAAAKDDDHYAELELTDKDGNTVKYRYSMADAKAEGLVKDRSRWTKRPGNMLRARCISNGLGMLCPEIFSGEGEDSESSPQAAPLLPTREAQKKEVQPAASNVINIEAAATPAPVAEPATEATKIYTEADIAIDPSTQRLTVNAMAALESVIGESNIPIALKWLKRVGWIKDSLSELAEGRAKNIMKKRNDIPAILTKEAAL
jgi:hypothetical protein